MSNVIGIGAAIASKGGPALPHRARQLRRRHQAARTWRGSVPALASRARRSLASASTRPPRWLSPGVLAVLTGEDLEADGRRRAALRLGHHRQGRIADEGAAASRRWRRAKCGTSAIRSRSSWPRRSSRREVPPRRSSSTMRSCRRSSACSTPLSADAPQLFDDVPNNLCCDWELGDKAATDAAFRRSGARRPESASSTIAWSETRWSRARRSPNTIAATGQYTLWTTSQFPHVVRLLMGAFVLNIPQHKLRVVAPDVGGGFGVKQFHYAEEAVLTWAAWQGRPADQMGLRPQRGLHVRRTGPRSCHRGRTGARRERQVSRRCGSHTLANMGGYLSTFGPNIPTNLYGPLLAGVYTTPAIYCEVKVVFTNTVPVDAYRGAGRPEATFVLERLVDVAASDMGIDRAEIRRRNMIPKEAYPYQTPVMVRIRQRRPQRLPGQGAGGVRLGGICQHARRRRRRSGKLRGIGLSTYVEACGLAPSRIAGRLGARGGLYESATVRVHPTGHVTVLIGTHNHGQGHETTFAQIVCEKLGVPFENIDIVYGDTDKVQFGMGTYGSRSLVVGGAALSKASDKMILKGKKIAAHLLGSSEQDIEFEAGEFKVAGTDRREELRGHRARRLCPARLSA